MFRLTALLTTLAVFTAANQSQAVSIASHDGDGYLARNESLELSTGGSTVQTVRIGREGDPPTRLERQAVYFFELPALAPGETISSASFSFDFTFRKDNGVGGPPRHSVDLYGLGWLPDPPALDATWFWASAADDVRTGDQLGTNIGAQPVVKIQDNILTTTQAGSPSSTPLGYTQTDAQGGAELVSFLDLLYAQGARAGDYAVLRMSPDADLRSDWVRGYHVSLSEHGGYRPTLVLTIVPEPSTLVLLAMGAVGLPAYAWRRRRA